MDICWFYWSAACDSQHIGKMLTDNVIPIYPKAVHVISPFYNCTDIIPELFLIMCELCPVFGLVGYKPCVISRWSIYYTDECWRTGVVWQ